jgi:hypothetical protein
MKKFSEEPYEWKYDNSDEMGQFLETMHYLILTNMVFTTWIVQ